MPAAFPLLNNEFTGNYAHRKYTQSACVAKIANSAMKVHPFPAVQFILKTLIDIADHLSLMEKYITSPWYHPVRLIEQGVAVRNLVIPLRRSWTNSHVTRVRFVSRWVSMRP